MFDPINAVSNIAGAFGKVIGQTWAVIKGWFTNEGPVKSALSVVKECLDSIIQGLKGLCVERPLVGIAAIAAAGLAAVFVLPKLLVGGGLNLVRQAARFIVGIPKALVGALRSPSDYRQWRTHEPPPKRNGLSILSTGM